MDMIIFGLCALTAGLCAFMLLRGFLHTKMRLLLWSGMCFTLLTISNIMLVADRWMFPEIQLMNLRLSFTLAGVVLLICGLIWERE